MFKHTRTAALRIGVVIGVVMTSAAIIMLFVGYVAIAEYTTTATARAPTWEHKSMITLQGQVLKLRQDALDRDARHEEAIKILNNIVVRVNELTKQIITLSHNHNKLIKAVQKPVVVKRQPKRRRVVRRKRRRGRK